MSTILTVNLEYQTLIWCARFPDWAEMNTCSAGDLRLDFE